VSDALDAIGRRRQVIQDSLDPLVPGMRAFGRAATLQFAPYADDPGSPLLSNPDPYGDMIDFIDGLRPGDVVVIATDGSRRSAFWGELFTAAAIGHAVAGIVCDGCLRDTAVVEQMGLPAFARGRRPVDYRGRMRVIASAVPVELSGVVVYPDDIVMADDDGIVVIPREDESEVLRRATERATTEGTVRSELLSGASLRSVWDRHHVL